MAKIIIRNIGPIKEASFDLNKINVFMGPQSSGKSAIAKIISYCTWVEKDVATSQSLETYQKNDNYFVERLETFHKLKKYFEKHDRYISYKSDMVEIEYSANNFSIQWNDRYAYKRSKISYIPSERNLVSLPDVNVKFADTNMRSFWSDWEDAQKKYTEIEKLSILDFDIDYCYDSNAEEYRIVHKQNDDSYSIQLSNASSGLQSVTPLIAMVDYLTNWYYKQEEDAPRVMSEKEILADKILVEELVLKKYFGDNFKKERTKENINEINEKIKAGDSQVRNLLSHYREIENNLLKTHNSQFIIEEPEQNLFPETQRKLVYHLLEKSFNKDGNRLTITTHSPYILYALNNCMMCGLVYDKMNASDKAKLSCKTSLVNPKDVSIYEIHKGILKSKQQNDGLISTNYFDTIMKESMDDFYIMLNYYN
ncbi:AAA family ATPase [Viscerimonas tarda]